MWFSFGSAVAQLWFILLWHDASYGVAVVQPWFSLVCPDVSCGSALVVRCVWHDLIWFSCGAGSVKHTA